MKNILILILSIAASPIFAQSIDQGWGNCEVSADPNTIAALDGGLYKCKSVYNTADNRWYQFEAANAAGSKWVEQSDWIINTTDSRYIEPKGDKRVTIGGDPLSPYTSTFSNRGSSDFHDKLNLVDGGFVRGWINPLSSQRLRLLYNQLQITDYDIATDYGVLFNFRDSLTTFDTEVRLNMALRDKDGDLGTDQQVPLSDANGLINWSPLPSGFWTQTEFGGSPLATSIYSPNRATIGSNNESITVFNHELGIFDVDANNQTGILIDVPDNVLGAGVLDFSYTEDEEGFSIASYSKSRTGSTYGLQDSGHTILQGGRDMSIMSGPNDTLQLGSGSPEILVSENNVRINGRFQDAQGDYGVGKVLTGATDSTLMWEWIKEKIEIPNTAFADVTNPKIPEVRTWVDANLTAQQKVNAQLYMIEDTESADVPRYIWSIIQDNLTRISKLITVVDNYTKLKSLSGDDCEDVIYVEDHTFQTNYIKAGGFFKKITTGTNDDVLTVVATDGTVWSRIFEEEKGYDASWWGATPDITFDNRNNIQTALDYVGSIGGGFLNLDKGTYLVTDDQVAPAHPSPLGAGVRVPSRVVLRGLGASTIINYDKDYSLGSGTGINLNGDYAELRGLQIKTTSFVERRGIAVTVAGTANYCNIENIVTDTWGGYNIYVKGGLAEGISKGNTISNCKLLNVADAGIEISGGANTTVTNCTITMKGTLLSGFAWGINIYSGAQNTTVSNISIEKTGTGQCTGISFQQEPTNHNDGIDVYGNIVSNVTGKFLDRGIELIGINSPSIRPLEVQIDACNFYGSSATTDNGVYVNYAHNISISNCNFYNFQRPIVIDNQVGGGLLQTGSENIVFTNCKFIDFGNASIIHGVIGLYFKNCSFVGNQGAFQSALDLKGVTHTEISNCLFKNIGNTSNSPAVVIGDNSGSSANISSYIKFNNNVGMDLRADAGLWRLIQLTGGTSNVYSTYNIMNGKTSGGTNVLINTGTGTNINDINQ